MRSVSRPARLGRAEGRALEPGKFEDQYETALVDLINQKRAGKPLIAKARPSGENVVDLMEALRKSVGGAVPETRAPKKPAKKSKKAASGRVKC
jgi:DNA end-binding protein Ku